MLPKTIRKYLPLRPHSPADSKSLAMKGLQENKNTERKENHACLFVHMLFIIPTAPLCACVCALFFPHSLCYYKPLVVLVTRIIVPKAQVNSLQLKMRLSLSSVRNPGSHNT